MPDLELVRRDWFMLPPVAVERSVRRCVEGHLARSLPAPCATCGEPTVGRALDAVYRGEDELVARDVARRVKAREVVFTLVAAVWGVAALRVLAWLVFEGVLRALVVLVTSAVFALFLHALIVFVARTILDSLRGRASHGEHVEDLAAKLDDFADRILEPFLARNGLGENAPVRVPPEELALLEQAFAHEGLVPRHGSLVSLIVAAALRRDVRKLRERLVATGAGDWFLAYARALPDGRFMSLFEQVLVDEGLDPESADAQVAARRADGKLASFLSDLEQRRGSDAVTLTVEALDGVETASFEALIGLLLEADGYESRAGCIERHGEKIALAIRQQSSAVDTPVVQEALVARAERGCDSALVVTNAGFTEAARELARTNRIELVDRDALRARVEAFNRAPRDHARVAALLRPRSA